MNKRVMVAMSGGVDSSVAAALLKEQGYEVIGVTMCFNIPDAKSKRPSCCGLQGIEDAKAVARKLDIKHYVLNFAKYLQEKIISDFCKEYLKGRTPNPCIRCNQYLKFDILLKKALFLGCRYLATGHYARIVCAKEGLYLKKAKDLHKDQSYFLYRLNQGQLKHILFPLGNLLKEEVRNLARKFRLPVSEKPGSQEICFVPRDNYREFLRQRLGDKIKPGDIVDKNGVIVGSHKGICFYTIGQRQGLNIAKGYPLYITSVDARSNKLIVGKRNEAYDKEFLLKNTNFIQRDVNKRVVFGVKIRYNHKESPAVVRKLVSGKYKVVFRKPQFAITPGQSAVFYKKDTVAGGGIIDKVIK